ncbi:MAG: hypothetical protein ACYCX4_13140 [Bacillota bacterium]
MNNNVIDQASTARPVVISPSWLYDPATGLYENTLQFTANFGNQTGKFDVVLEATRGTYKSTKHISVQNTVTPQHLGQFKNHGQLVSYLTKELKQRGYTGKNYNHGQILKYCLKKFSYQNVTVAEIKSYLGSTSFKNTLRTFKKAR